MFLVSAKVQSKKGQREYKRILITVVAAFVAVVLLMLCYSFVILKNGTVDTFYYFTKGNAISAMNETGKFLDNVRSTLFSLAKDNKIHMLWFEKQPDSEELPGIQDTLLASRMNVDNIDSYYIYNESTRMIYVSHKMEYLSIDSLSEDDKHIAEMIDRMGSKEAYREFFVLPARAYQKSLCVLYYPYSNSNNCIIMQIDSKKLIDNFDALEFYENCHYMLLNKDGSLFYSNFTQDRSINDYLMIAKKNETGKEYRLVKIGGKEYFYAEFKIDAFEKSLIVSIPLSSVYENAIFDRMHVFLLTLSWVLFFILIVMAILWKTFSRYERFWKKAYITRTLELNPSGEKQKILQSILEKSDHMEWEMIPERELATFLHGNIMLILFRLKCTNCAEGCDVEMAKLKVSEALEKAFSDLHTESIFLEDAMFCILLEDKGNLSVRQVKKGLATARSQVSEHFTAAIGTGTSWKNLKQELEKLTELMSYRYIYGEDADLTADMIQSPKDNVFSALLQHLPQLKRHLLENCTGEAQKLQAELWERLRGITPNEIKTFVVLLLQVYNDVFEFLAKKTDYIFDFNYGEELKKNLNAEILLQIQENFNHYLTMLDISVSVERTNRYEQLCRRVKEVVADRYYDCALGTEKIAEFLGTSPGYLGKLFKKYEGISILNYILNFRMMKAKKILESEETYNIAEVAKMVGYNDPSYFGALFKKEFRMTPGAYRQSKKRK